MSERPRSTDRPPRTGWIALALVVLVALALAPRSEEAASEGTPRPSGPLFGESLRRDTTEFRHRDHRSVACATCHPSEDTHGGLVVTRREHCLRCHHLAQDEVTCTRCHAERGLRGATTALRTLQLSTGPTGERPLSFDHGDHETVECSRCHTGGPALSAAELPCGECHEDHHRLDSRCTVCHLDPPADAHPVEVAHLTCEGSGCHTSLPYDRVPRSRQACLVCHRDLTDHRPGRPCAECHAIPGRDVSSGAVPGGRLR